MSSSEFRLPSEKCKVQGSRGCRGNTSQWEVAHLLADLYVLLEAYGPIWYTQELHDRIYMSIRLLLESPQGRE
jgi:hypothetical protein